MLERIQQKRVKGWRKPENTVIVSRPSKWGNPYTMCDDIVPGTLPDEAHRMLRDMFTDWLFGVADTDWEQERRVWMLNHLDDLKGRSLACYCKEGYACHADVLLDCANWFAQHQETFRSLGLPGRTS